MLEFKAIYSCPPRKNSYCNFVMAMVYENAKYSLHQITEVLQDEIHASVLRTQGVLGNKDIVKEIVMRATLISGDRQKGITPTLQEATLNFNQIKNTISDLKLKLQLLQN